MSSATHGLLPLGQVDTAGEIVAAVNRFADLFQHLHVIADVGTEVQDDLMQLRFFDESWSLTRTGELDRLLGRLTSEGVGRICPLNPNYNYPTGYGHLMQRASERLAPVVIAGLQGVVGSPGGSPRTSLVSKGDYDEVVDFVDIWTSIIPVEHLAGSAEVCNRLSLPHGWNPLWANIRPAPEQVVLGERSGLTSTLAPKPPEDKSSVVSGEVVQARKSHGGLTLCRVRLLGSGHGVAFDSVLRWALSRLESQVLYGEALSPLHISGRIGHEDECHVVSLIWRELVADDQDIDSRANRALEVVLAHEHLMAVLTEHLGVVAPEHEARSARASLGSVFEALLSVAARCTNTASARGAAQLVETCMAWNPRLALALLAWSAGQLDGARVGSLTQLILSIEPRLAKAAIRRALVTHPKLEQRHISKAFTALSRVSGVPQSLLLDAAAARLRQGDAEGAALILAAGEWPNHNVENLAAPPNVDDLELLVQRSVLGGIAFGLRELNWILEGSRLPSLDFNGDMSEPWGLLKGLAARDGRPGTDSGPLVSVIMTATNASSTVAFALRSVLGQSHRNLELLFLNDASDDETAEVARATAGNDPRVRWFATDRRVGPYVGRNLLLDVARGDFVAIADADDYSHPDRFRVQIQRLLVSNSNVSVGRNLRISAASTVSLDKDLRFVGDGPMTSLFDRDVFHRVGRFHEVLTRGDLEFLGRCRVLLGEQAIDVINQPLVLAGYSPESNSRRFRKSEIDGYKMSYWAWHEQLRLQSAIAEVTSEFRYEAVPVALRPDLSSTAFNEVDFPGPP